MVRSILFVLFPISWLFNAGKEVYVILAFLAVPIYFVWSWILKKIIRNKRIRKPATLAITVVSTPFIFYGLLMALFFYLAYYPKHDFDQVKWLAKKEKRYEMSGDIIESKMLIGKTKNEVIQILGDEGNRNESDHWTYYLGDVPRFITIDPDVLDIDFNKGKVVAVGQHET